MTADKIYPSAAAHIRAMAAFALADLGGRADGTLAQNESAFPPSPRAIAAGQAAVAASRLYPDPDCLELRAALAEAYSVPAEEIHCGAGSMDLIGSLVRAFAGDGGTVLSTVYAYSFIAAAAAQAAMPYASVAERELSVDVDAVLAGVTAATRLVVVCNPGNPTGTRIDNREILRLGAALPAEVLLVVDQAYGEFDDQDPRPVFDLVRGGRAVVTRSLSKAYGLAGARVGWGLFPPAVAAEMRKVQHANNVAAVSQAMAVAAVRDQAYMRATVARTAAIRDRFLSRLTDAGYAVVRSHTNFVLVPFHGPAMAAAAERRLRAAGIIVRPLGGYGLGHCLRITIGADDPMERTAGILAAMEQGREPN